jgi:hypothetical protein
MGQNKQRAATIPENMRASVLSDALGQLVRLYKQSGKQDDAARWQKELEAYRKSSRPTGK